MLRTLRQSFRRKKHPKVPESSRPHQWQQDEEAVKAARCSFQVKYLGSVEVQESRGMHVCEQAVKQLKSNLRKSRAPHFFGRRKKKKIQAILYVSPDALRVVENSTKALMLDQTIEKVSFCAPDRNYDRAFSYICRDGTTRRWLCHSFFAIKESGERLSHAVGCAFALCLEKKQKREKDTGVTVTYDKNRTTFYREGSFRVQTLTEQQENANLAKPAGPDEVKAQVHNPSALPRPHAPLHLIRQASLRQFGSKKDEDSSGNTPFKRNYSLQVNNLPSTVNRQKFQIMNPVPEIEEASEISKMASQITSTFSSNNNDDPFAKVSMPKPVNGFDDILKPTQLTFNNTSDPFALPQTGFPGANSPVRDTNPWAGDTRQQQPVLMTHKRTPSEADRWLSSIQQQTGSVPMATNTTFPVATQNGTHPYNWSNQQSEMFKMKF